MLARANLVYRLEVVLRLQPVFDRLAFRDHRLFALLVLEFGEVEQFVVCQYLGEAPIGKLKILPRAIRLRLQRGTIDDL